MAESRKASEFVMDPEAVVNVLRNQTREIAHEMAQSLGAKLEGLHDRLEATVCALDEVRGRQHKVEEKIEHQARQKATEEWYEKAPEGDRDHLRKTDKDLRDLEAALGNTQSLLEEGEGDSRQIVKEDAVWAIPRYEAVKPDPPKHPAAP